MTQMTQNPPQDSKHGESTPQVERQPELGKSVELVHRAQEGNKEALNELFERYHDRVHRIARIRMGARVRSFMESVDLVQNTYVVAMRRFSSFEMRNHASIIQWLSRILENQIHDAADYAIADKRNRDHEVPIGEGTSSTTGFVVKANEPPPYDKLEKSERREIFDACVQLLDPKHREVILVRDYAGGSWDYVAKETGSPSVHAAQEMHRRARIKLARLVSKRVDFGE